MQVVLSLWKKKKNEGVHSGREAKADTDGSSEPA